MLCDLSAVISYSFSGNSRHTDFPAIPRTYQVHSHLRTFVLAISSDWNALLSNWLWDWLPAPRWKTAMHYLHGYSVTRIFYLKFTVLSSLCTVANTKRMGRIWQTLLTFHLSLSENKTRQLLIINNREMSQGEIIPNQDITSQSSGQTGWTWEMNNVLYFAQMNLFKFYQVQSTWWDLKFQLNSESHFKNRG